MRTILKIGGYQFMLPPSTKLDPILTAFKSSVPVRSHYEDGQYYYTDDSSHVPTIEIEMIQANQYHPPVPAHPAQLSPIQPRAIRNGRAPKLLPLSIDIS